MGPKPITFPAIGNHEYKFDPTRQNATGYSDYFGPAARGPDFYYSYDLGSWRVFVLNTGDIQYARDQAAIDDSCYPEPCDPGSAQATWLRDQLALVPASKCVLAYWHHPRYSSAVPGDHVETAELFDALYDHGADVVLAGHAHSYERFRPMDSAGNVDEVRGIRSFVVGTGGEERFIDPSPLDPGSAFYLGASEGFGVLEMTLHQNSYDFRFVKENGEVRDPGSAACHA